MRWFYNMKIGVKLIVSFILIALIAGIVGVVGIINIRTMDTEGVQLYEKNTVPIELVGSAAIDYHRTRVNMRDVILSDTTEKAKAYADRLEQLREDMMDKIAQYEKTIDDNNERKLYDTLKSAIDRYTPIQQQILDLCMAGKKDEAIALMGNSETTKLIDEIKNTMDEVLKYNINGAGETAKRNGAVADNAAMIMIILVIVAVVLAILLGIFISRIISKPVNKMVAAANKLAQGELDINIDIDTKDEIGQLGKAFAIMSDNLNEVLTNISAASEQVASGAKQVSDSSMALSQGATEQASSIEELTASIEEISAQTNQNAASANEANMLAETARANAIQGNEQMKDMLNAMEEINESSANISKIIKVIDEIAFQTNILALNAAVEAARAGQHGKGFAVVAEEVRNLAARSANAAKETTDMIEGSIKKVDGGTKIAKDTADALNEIVDGVAKVAGLVSDIAVASNEQAAGISQINQGVMQVSQVVQTNSATSEESAAASEELSGQAELLREQVSRFKLRKNRSKSYKDFEEINPEVLKMLENMSERRRNSNSAMNDAHEEAAVTSSKKIVLSDNEFGKY